uniref:Uncharacterized protein n=1 Tax=Mesocestoides corti TaxID=53468 RepID=A0A5K3G3Q2_MESCO
MSIVISIPDTRISASNGLTICRTGQKMFSGLMCYHKFPKVCHGSIKHEAELPKASPPMPEINYAISGWNSRLRSRLPTTARTMDQRNDHTPTQEGGLRCEDGSRHMD